MRTANERMKRIGYIVLGAVGWVAVGVVGFIAILWGREWRPEPVEVLGGAFPAGGMAGGDACLRRGDTVRVISWNIGYAGLGDDMDFFYDGGTRMRTSRDRTAENLHEILSFLTHEAAGRRRADFILLQEVDAGSRRSYRLNEFDSVGQALAACGYVGWRGLNYVCDFVPVPLTEPMGRVESGVAIFSRWRPERVVRYAYPGGFPFPVRLFNLKRCLLSAELPVRDSADGSGRRYGTLFLNNTHNTAYDAGGMREGELHFLRGFLTGKRYSLTMGDWNCNPPGYRPSRAAVEDRHFRPLAIDGSAFPPEMTFACDTSVPSVRYGYEPYRTGRTTTTILDFALCGPGIEAVGVETIDLGFKNSDHNPVAAVFVIR